MSICSIKLLFLIISVCNKTELVTSFEISKQTPVNSGGTLTRLTNNSYLDAGGTTNLNDDYIFWYQQIGSYSKIWRMDFDGSNKTQISSALDNGEKITAALIKKLVEQAQVE